MMLGTFIKAQEVMAEAQGTQGDGDWAEHEDNIEMK